MADKHVQEQQVVKLKRLLEGWRMALLPLKSVMLWEKQWHPCAIIGSLTIFYMIIWLMDLNFLTTFAMIGLFFNFLDFIVPIICNTIYSANSWNGKNEKMFEDICASIIYKYNNIKQAFSLYGSLRTTSPCLYYIVSISGLMMMAWVTSAVDNVLLLYILSTVVLLWPGIQHKGVFGSVIISKLLKMSKSE